MVGVDRDSVLAVFKKVLAVFNFLERRNLACCKQGQPRVHEQDIEFGPALAHNGRNVLKIAERVLLVKMLDIRNVVFQISIICMFFST